VTDVGWSGLAAAFIAAGAINYLGSLWPIFDESSKRMSESFYRHLHTGTTVGEALQRARIETFAGGPGRDGGRDATWAAYVLFGCPRNRLRPPS
jgi:CHAT domain-containing protein